MVAAKAAPAGPAPHAWPGFAAYAPGSPGMLPAAAVAPEPEWRHSRPQVHLLAARRAAGAAQATPSTVAKAESRVWIEHPVDSAAFDELLLTLSDVGVIQKRLKESQMMLLYVGSFQRGAQIIANDLSQLMQRDAKLASLGLTSDLCDKIHRLVFEEIARHIPAEGLELIEKLSLGDLKRLSSSCSGNLVSSAVDFLLQLKRLAPTAAHEVRSGGSPVDPESHASHFRVRTKDETKSGEVADNLAEMAEQLHSLDRTLISRDHLEMLKSAKVLDQLRPVEDWHVALAYVAAAIDRGLMFVTSSCPRPDVDYKGVSANALHFWLGALRWEQQTWAQQAELDIKNLERRAVSEMAVPGGESKDDFKKSWLNPPYSYFNFKVTPREWKRQLTKRVAETGSPYFHFLKDVAPRLGAPPASA